MDGAIPRVDEWNREIREKEAKLFPIIGLNAASVLAKMSDCCAKWERKGTLLDGAIIRIVDRFETRALDPRAKRVTDRRTGNGLSSVPSIKGSSIQSNSHSG